jgi:hypothetical protein
MKFSGASYVTIQGVSGGFTVKKTNASADPVLVKRGTGITLDNLSIVGPGSWDCVSIDNENGVLTYLTVQNCEIVTSAHEGVYIASRHASNAIHHLYIKNNDIHDCGDEAVQVSAQNATGNPPSYIYISGNDIYDAGAWGIIHLYYCPTNVVIERNYIHDCTACWVGISLDGGSTTIKNNLIADCSTVEAYNFAGVDVSNEHGTPTFLIYHNSFIRLNRGTGGTAAYGIYVYSANASSYIKDNIFYDIEDEAIHNDYASLRDGQYNLFYDPAGTGGTAINDNGTTYTYANVGNWGTANIQGNPNFVAPASDDFHLQSNSPARNAGVNVGVTEDFDRLSRPQGNGYDIGAYEYDE